MAYGTGGSPYCCVSEGPMVVNLAPSSRTRVRSVGSGESLHATNPLLNGRGGFDHGHMGVVGGSSHLQGAKEADIGLENGDGESGWLISGETSSNAQSTSTSVLADDDTLASSTIALSPKLPRYQYPYLVCSNEPDDILSEQKCVSQSLAIVSSLKTAICNTSLSTIGARVRRGFVSSQRRLYDASHIGRGSSRRPSLTASRPAPLKVNPTKMKSFEYDLIITNGTCITAVDIASYDIAIKDEKIVLLAPSGSLARADAGKIIDAEGGYVTVSPGKCWELL